ncbi:MAG: DUF1893 domain-containing protein [Dehalococcoidales bacterium]|nr:DUF1893 domain-containing protein [Dehalococcoidales bacterium]
MSGKVANQRFIEFLRSRDTLRVYKNNRLLFVSNQERLLPLLEYLAHFSPYEVDVVVFDRVVGNAAALLLKKILCREVYSELGSENAIKTLVSSGIDYHFNKTVPYIENDSRQDMCPMEKLSLGKSPEEFYEALKKRSC